jgi:ferric iron reductase protein FhuF
VTDLAGVLGAVAAHVSYLRASTTLDGDDWVRCDALVGDDAVLRAVVERAAPGFGTDDLAVTASLFTQAYAFRAAGVGLAAYALGLPVPDVGPASNAVRVDKPRPSAVAYVTDTVHEYDAPALAAALLDGHLAPFVDHVHACFTVGARLLWGNVAASCAVAFRAVESSGADAAMVRERAEAFVGASGRWFDGLGAFTTVRADDRTGWFWDRTSCCLWYKASGGKLCDNCSLIEPSELQAQRIRELTEAGA